MGQMDLWSSVWEKAQSLLRQSESEPRWERTEAYFGLRARRPTTGVR
jgi:hypothetical protein